MHRNELFHSPTVSTRDIHTSFLPIYDSPPPFWTFLSAMPLLGSPVPAPSTFKVEVLEVGQRHPLFFLFHVLSLLLLSKALISIPMTFKSAAQAQLSLQSFIPIYSTPAYILMFHKTHMTKSEQKL